MTSRERVWAALAHREPDRTPIFEYVLQPPVADAILGRPYAYGRRLAVFISERGWEAGIRQAAADVVELAGKLRYDMIYEVPNRLPPPPPGNSDPPTRKPSDDPIEEMTHRVREGEAIPSEPPGDSLFIYACLREEMKKRELDLPILAPAYAHGTSTDTVLMQAMILAPELVERLFAERTRAVSGLIKRYGELGIDMIGIGGDFAGTRGPICSPAAYRRFMVPELKKLADLVRSLGCFSVNASDGNLWPVIDDFLIGTGVDGYIEIDFFAGMDLGELKRRFGDRITFFGNLDCGNKLSFGSVDEIKAHTKECLEKGLGHGGHILCASNAITASVPLANYLAVPGAYREFFGL